MLVKVLREFIDEEATRRRLVILQRSDGYFTYGEEYYYISEYEGEIIAEGWSGTFGFGIYADVDLAERDARVEYSNRFSNRS